MSLSRLQQPSNCVIPYPHFPTISLSSQFCNFLLTSRILTSFKLLSRTSVSIGRSYFFHFVLITSLDLHTQSKSLYITFSAIICVFSLNVAWRGFEHFFNSLSVSALYNCLIFLLYVFLSSLGIGRLLYLIDTNSGSGSSRQSFTFTQMIVHHFI